METQYLIPESLRVALINYLAQKPFAEVSQVIPALQRLQKAPEPDANGLSTPSPYPYEE